MGKAMTAPAPQPRPVIESPCVLVCMVDGKSGLCFGCKRTLAEIGRWSRMTAEERRAVMDDLPRRPTPQPA